MKRHLFRRMGRFLRPQAPSLAGAAALAALSGLLALLVPLVAVSYTHLIVNFTFLIEQHIELYQTCQYLRKNYHYSNFSKSAEDSLAGADLTNDRRIS